MRNLKVSIVALATALFASVGFAGNNPYNMPDESWITISGKVLEPRANAFTLDYGEGMITVEVDDWDRYDEAHVLPEGDSVTVHGRIDDDLYEVAKIEASSVYSEQLGTTYLASPVDEEGAALTAYNYIWVNFVPPQQGATTITGKVVATDADEKELLLQTGTRHLKVEVDELNHNPLDDYGLQRVKPGDVVSVSGHMDTDFFEGRVLQAQRIVTLRNS